MPFQGNANTPYIITFIAVNFNICYSALSFMCVYDYTEKCSIRFTPYINTLYHLTKSICIVENLTVN